MLRGRSNRHLKSVCQFSFSILLLSYSLSGRLLAFGEGDSSLEQESKSNTQNTDYVTHQFESVFDNGPRINVTRCDRKSWMEMLYSQRPYVKLKDMMIPGTHNSASSYITKDSDWAMGSEKNLPKLARRIGRKAAVKWGRTQRCSITSQLNHGIRFLDLRIAPSLSNPKRLYVVHGVVSAPLEFVMNEIANFVAKHPRELIIIKRRLAYDFRKNHPDLVNETSHQMNSEIWGKIGAHILVPEDLETLTFDSFWSRQKSIAMIDEPKGILNTWSDSRTNKIDQLPSKLAQALREQKQGPGRFLELAAYITPETTDILGKIASRRKNQLLHLQKDYLPEAHRHVNKWREEGLKINILSTDFYEATRLVNTIIAHNLMELDESK